MAPVTRSRSLAKNSVKGSGKVLKDPVVVVRKTKKIRSRKKSTAEDTPRLANSCPEPPILRHPPVRFGLMQELVSHDLYSLLVQTILWNQTRGTQAKPVLFRLLTEYPDPGALAEAPLAYLTEMLYPIGLHNIRAARLISFAKAWLEQPPCLGQRFRKVDYPVKGSGRDIRPNEVLKDDDPRAAWEVAHLPGMGAYALDTFRIFARDQLRGLEDEDGMALTGSEPEWTRVVPLDKDLRRYMIWRWEREGFEYNPLTGGRKAIQKGP